MILRYLIAAVLLCLVPTLARAQAQCDQDKSCVGTALTIERTQGKGAQYVDIDRSAKLMALDTALTFEAWLNPVAQPGRRQYVAGLWGPNRDNNDQWVIYIEDTRIVFALSAPGSRAEASRTSSVSSAPSAACTWRRAWRRRSATPGWSWPIACRASGPTSTAPGNRSSCRCRTATGRRRRSNDSANCYATKRFNGMETFGE